MQKFVLLVKEQRDSEISDLLFRIFGRRDEVHRFEMSEIDVPTEYIYVEQLLKLAWMLEPDWQNSYLADVFLFLIAVQAAIWKGACQSRLSGQAILKYL